MDNENKRILVIQMSSMGDIVNTLPALYNIRKEYPTAYIAWLVRESFFEVLEKNPHIDEIIVFPDILTKKFQRLNPNRNYNILELRNILDFIRKIRNRKFDTTIDFHNITQSGIIAFLSGAKKRIGFQRKKEKEFSQWFNNIKVRTDERNIHIVDQYLGLLSPLGINSREAIFDLGISKEDNEYVENFFKGNYIKNDDLIIGIHPGTTWERKKWKFENFIELSNRLINSYDAKVILFWGDIEKDLIMEIKDINERIIIAPMTNFRQLAAFLKKCKIFISCDTGALHVASAVGTTTIGLFGPTDSKVTGPYRNGYVIKSPLKCSPCVLYWQKVSYEDIITKCPLDCMSYISIDDVLSTVKKIINRTN